jgi:hypothetical protein
VAISIYRWTNSENLTVIQGDHSATFASIMIVGALVLPLMTLG